MGRVYKNTGSFNPSGVIFLTFFSVILAPVITAITALALILERFE